MKFDIIQSTEPQEVTDLINKALADDWQLSGSLQIQQKVISYDSTPYRYDNNVESQIIYVQAVTTSNSEPYFYGVNKIKNDDYDYENEWD